MAGDDPARRPHDVGHHRGIDGAAPRDADPVRSRRPPPAGRPAAAQAPRRRAGPGPSARRRRADRAHGGGEAAGLDHPVGPAGQRQDDHRAPAGRGDRPRLRAALGRVFRRRRPAQGVRAGARPARGGRGHASLRRRDPPLQPRPAGRVPALCRGRHGDPGRRDHREPVLRAQRRPAVALPGLRAAPPRRRGAGGAAEARRGDREAPLAARRPRRAPRSAPWRTATGATC